jgi:magnesium transporter
MEPAPEGGAPPEPENEQLSFDELREAWHILSRPDRIAGWRLLPRTEQEEFFLGLNALDQEHLIMSLPQAERRSWVRQLPPDDAADLVQVCNEEERKALLTMLDDATRTEVQALLAYAEDDAGGLMSPRYARLRPDMTVDEAITYLRKQARERLETIYYAYVLSPEQHLLGVVSFRDLFKAQGTQPVRDVMKTELVVVPEAMPQEEVSKLFADNDLVAMPVIDERGRMKGIVTVDDIVDVVEEAATEDIQKLGGTEALGEPYLQISLGRMVRKRAIWLAVLFLGEMLTASAMGHFEDELARALVLSLFIPLIISSGGNSGSQATTLVIRALALGEMRLRDWYRVMRREFAAGLVLGGILALIGITRIIVWQGIFHPYGEHYVLIAFTVGASLVGVVLFGTLAGSLLPFILKRLGLDPASASAPFVATLVDVTGLVIYFTAASLILRGTLL